ncbi:MAG: transposase [Armatimonadetes bacterium]|nr:transposase [Armatimonadota bacterium]
MPISHQHGSAPVPASCGPPIRARRQGTANLLVLFEPLRGWRHLEVTDPRTRKGVARILKALAEVYSPEADQIVLVMDNLNTHTLSSLYDILPAAEAKRLADKFEIHYTPKHGRGLNMAEIEWSVLARQCLEERIPDKASLCQQVLPWETRRNQAETRVDGRLTAADARIKLRRLYPSILP